MTDRKIRVLVAKPGLDGHDRGAKVIARALRDAGMEVIYTGLRQTPEMIAAAALQEDVDAVGVSILSGAHNTLCPRIVELLQARGMDDCLVLVGGIVPKEDVPRLKEMGVAEVFLPGTSTEDIVTFLRENVRPRTWAFPVAFTYMQDAEQTGHTPSIIVEERGSTIILRLNRPAERNALSLSVLAELNAGISALSKRTDISALIFTGTGEAFASGANIRELRALKPATARDFARRGQRLMQMIADAPQRTIAAVNGYCMGGGLDLALACDLRCAAPSAVFAHPGARLGIITGWGGTQRLPQLIGSARAFEMFLTARKVSGAEALEMGLVNRLGENALDCALEISSNV